MVIKMRRGQHSIDIREYQITSRGLEIGGRLRGYWGLTTGVPGPWDPAHPPGARDEPDE